MDKLCVDKVCVCEYRLTFRRRSTWLSTLAIFWVRRRCSRFWSRSRGLAKVGVVCGELVSGCHVLVLTHFCHVPLHDFPELLVGLLPVVLISALEDREVNM